MSIKNPLDTPQDRPKRSLSQLFIVTLALLLSCLPYAYAYLRRDDRVYLWLGFNFDDACVYLSWIEQAAKSDHPFLVYNLFTTEPQVGMLANPLFLTLGLLSKLTHLAPITLFHLSRIVFGALLFWRVGKLLVTLGFPKATHPVIFAMIAFSSGLGWLPGLWERDGIASPIDRWQPEAVTFLSLLLNPLFLVSLLLQVLTLDLLVKSTTQSDLKSRRNTAICAGLSLALLTLTHTYDLISLTIVWVLYAAYHLMTTKEVRLKKQLLLTTGVVAVVTLPALLLMAFSLRQNALFASRVAVETASPAPIWTILGYGGTLVFAILPLLELRKKETALDQGFQGTGNEITPPATVSVPQQTFVFLALWFVGQVLASYLPVSFQRKMIQGTHLPLAMLAGFAIYSLWHGDCRVIPNLSLKKIPYLVFATGTVVLLSLSNLRFILREMSNSDANLVQTGQHRAYIAEPEQKAIEWLEQNGRPNETVQALPWLTLIEDSTTGHRKIAVKDMTLPVLIPALTGLHAYCAHFGETPDFGGKLILLSRFTSGKMPLSERLEFRKQMGVTYLLFTQTPTVTHTDAEIAAAIESALRETTASNLTENSLLNVILINNVR